MHKNAEELSLQTIIIFIIAIVVLILLILVFSRSQFGAVVNYFNNIIHPITNVSNNPQNLLNK